MSAPDSFARLGVLSPGGAHADVAESLASALPRLDPRTVVLPDPMAMVQWRKVADARMEAALASFDECLLEGVDGSEAAQRVLAPFVAWTRHSVGAFVTARGSRAIGASLRADEDALWTARMEQACEHAPHDPSSVDRFLRIWLATVHEASATGYAALFGTAKTF